LNSFIFASAAEDSALSRGWLYKLNVEYAHAKLIISRGLKAKIFLMEAAAIASIKGLSNKSSEAKAQAILAKL
jgi:hypothetical protein